MTQSKKTWGVLSLLLGMGVFGYCLARATASGIPAAKPLVYSGVLTDTAGAPLSGVKNIQIAISNADGSSKCGTDPAPKTLSAGAFSVELPDACTTLVHQTPDLFIEVFVDGSSVGKSKMGAVPFAVEADRASAATGALDTRITAVEAHGVKSFAWGWLNACTALGTFSQAGYTNVLVRASLFTDAACTKPANDPATCHPFCASQLLRDPANFNQNCCGATYWTNGVVESIGYK